MSEAHLDSLHPGGGGARARGLVLAAPGGHDWTEAAAGLDPESGLGLIDEVLRWL